MKYKYVSGKTKKEALQKVRSEYGDNAFIYEEEVQPVKSIMGKLFNKKEYIIRIGLSEKATRSRSDSLKQLQDMLRKKEESQKKLEATISSSKSMKQGYSSVLSKSVHEDHAFENANRNSDISKAVTLPVFSQGGIPVEPQSRSLAAPQEKNLYDNSYKNNTPENHEDFNLLQKDVKSILSYLKKVQESPAPAGSEFSDILSLFEEQMFTKSWIKEFMDSLKKDIPQNEWKNKKILEKKLVDLLSLRIKTASSVHSKRIITLIGPTGSGKTTTIAKIAKKIKFDNSMSLLLVTMDNYRIAATEQLKVYGNIMDIPVRMVKNREEFEELVNDTKYDRILIDTPGFSPANEDLMEKLHGIIRDYSSAIDKHLVLPANMKKNDILKNIERFSILETDKIILSKLDETNTIGYFIELAEEWNYPFSFITNGQRVPEDIMEAEKRFVSEFIAKKIKWQK